MMWSQVTLCRLPRQIYLNLCLALLVAMAYHAAAQVAQSQPSHQEILQELATTQRMLADEEYIAGHLTNAKAEYDAASITIGRLSTDGGFLTEASIHLQQDEIQYRKLLLERQESFWGLQFTARPLNPVAEFDKFETTYTSFKNLVDDVDKLGDQLKTGQMGSYTLEDQQIQNERDKRVDELSKDIADVRLRDADVRRSMYQDRNAAIQDRQKEIVKEVSDLQKQVADRSAAMNATLTSALAGAVGLPPDSVNILNGAAKGDYSGVVAAAVQQYAVSPDVTTGLSGQLQSLAVSAQDAAKTYEKTRQTVDDLQKKATEGAALLKAIQSNDRDKLVAIGMDAMGQLSPATRDQLEAGVGKLKDVEGVLKLAGNGTAVRAQIANYIGSNPDLSAKIGPLVTSYLDSHSESFAWRYQQLLKAEMTTSQTANEQIAVFTAVTRGWSRSLVQNVLSPQGAVVKTATALGSACTNDLDCSAWLTDYVTRNGLTGQIVAVSASGDVTITVKGQVAARFSVKDVANITAGRALEVATTDAQSDIDALLKRIQSGGDAFVGEVVRSLPDADFDRDINPIVESLVPARASELVQTLTSPGVINTVAPASQDMAALTLGSEIAKKTIFSAVPIQTVPPAVAQAAAQATPGDNPSQALILTAMKAAGPYGYAAAMAIQVFSGIAQNGVAIEQINAKAQEDQKLTVEMLHIAGFEGDMNRDEAIAALEQRIATAQATSADSRSDLYEQAMVDQGTQATALQAKIRRRLPLLFLLSEELRERFDVLDHALGFWENDLSSDGQFLEKTVRNDPQFRRLGLDPDISLYDWFNRDAEGERQDLDALLVHWEELETLVKGLCATLHCTPTDSQMGQVEMTDLISLRKLVGLTDWAAAAKSRTLLFTLLPQSLPNVPARQGLRVVHASGAVSDRADNYHLNPNIVLRHSGLGYVSADGAGYRETLQPSGDLTPKFPIDDIGASDLQMTLQGRWSPNTTLQPLEGYPLYGLYRVMFPPNFDFATSDLVLRFFYQWPVNGALLDRRNLVVDFSCTNSDGSRIPIPASDVSLLLTKDANGLPTLGDAKGCSVLEGKP